MRTAHVANICERWGMSLLPTSEENESWFLDWVLRSPRDASVHLTAGWHAYHSLRDLYGYEDITDVHECFGGMGAQSLMIQSMFYAYEHTVGEYSWEAVKHLERVLKEKAQVSMSDAYSPDLNLVGVDLVGLDFGDLTVWKTREGEPHRRLLDKTFGAGPKAVVLTDVACRYLHLHRERYESLLGPGTCMSYDLYLDALVARLGSLYGYRLQGGFSHRWSTVMAFVPEDGKPAGVIVPTPSDPVGLELL